mgnify:FL=1
MKIKSIISIALLLLCISCSNDETLENTKNSKDLEVVNLNDFVDNGNTTRSGNVENQAVLRFKDYNVYQETLNKLQGMSLEKKEAFFNGLGFKGAYSSLKEADDELDKIFDIEDDNAFLEAYKEFKDKYEDTYLFNTENTYDLSPYLPFTDAELELLGSNQGYLIIGNEVIAPNNNVPNYKQNPTSVNTRAGIPSTNPTWKALVGDVLGVTIKKGKYRSDITLGIDEYGNIFMVRAASQKKKKLWSRRHPTNYEADLWVEGGHVHISLANNGSSSPKKEPVAINARQYSGKNVKCAFRNFTTGCCEGQVGNVEFNVNIP